MVTPSENWGSTECTPSAYETVVRNIIDALGESKELFVNETPVTVAGIIELAKKNLELNAENEKLKHKLQLISDYLNSYSSEEAKK